MYIPPKVKPVCPPEFAPKYEDVEYARVKLDDGSDYSLKLDIYQKISQKTLGPCVVYFFGGGWIKGDFKQKTSKGVYCRDLVNLVAEGLTVVCADYRLASQSVFPACVYDAKGVIRFLKANSEKFNIDPERIGLLGNSAGAHLAAMIGYSHNDKSVEGDVGGNLDVDSSVKALALFYTPTDLVELINDEISKNFDAELLSKTEIDDMNPDPLKNHKAFILGYKGTTTKLAKLIKDNDVNNPDYKYIELAKKMSPINYISKDIPASIILHGGQDDIVPIKQSWDMYQKACECGANMTFISYSLAQHGPSMGPELDRVAYKFLLENL